MWVWRRLFRRGTAGQWYVQGRPLYLPSLLVPAEDSPWRTRGLISCWPMGWAHGAGPNRSRAWVLMPTPPLPLELPVTLVRPLRDKIAMERHRGVLECQLSRASAQVRWFKGHEELQPGAKYDMVSDGVYRKLVIRDVHPEDEDTYTCDAGDVQTSAQFFVEGVRLGTGRGSLGQPGRSGGVGNYGDHNRETVGGALGL